MILKAIDKFIDTTPIERLFTEGEKYSDIIKFSLPKINNDVDISDCIFVMRTVASTGEMMEYQLSSSTDEENEDRIIVSWYPDEYVSAVPGMLSLELICSKGSERIVKYKMPAIYVKAAVMGEGLPVPDVIEEKLALMNEVLANANEKLALMDEKLADANEILAGIGTEAEYSIDQIKNAEALAIKSIESVKNEVEAALENIIASLQEVVVLSVKYTLNSDGILIATGTGDIATTAIENKEKITTAEIDIDGEIGIGAFASCPNLGMATVNCNKICDKAFAACPKLNTFTIGKSVTEIGSEILLGSGFDISVGLSLFYLGTVSEWNAVTKAENWTGSPVTIKDGVVTCSDGAVAV